MASLLLKCTISDIKDVKAPSNIYEFFLHFLKIFSQAACAYIFPGKNVSKQALGIQKQDFLPNTRFLSADKFAQKEDILSF